MKLTFIKRATAGSKAVKLPVLTLSVPYGRIGFNQPAQELLKLQPDDQFALAQDEQENWYAVVQREATEDTAEVTEKVAGKGKSVGCLHKAAVAALVDTLPSKIFGNCTTLSIPLAGERTKNKEYADARIFGLLTAGAKPLRMKKEPADA